MQSKKKEDDTLHDLAVEAQKNGYLTPKESKAFLDKYLCYAQLNHTLKPFLEEINLDFYKLEVEYHKTLWITLVSSKFNNMELQERARYLTSLLHQKAPEVFYNWLFGFKAFTPEEWNNLDK